MTYMAVYQNKILRRVFSGIFTKCFVLFPADCRRELRNTVILFKLAVGKLSELIVSSPF